jgi:hypothetical protein
MTKPYDTGETSDYDPITWPQSKITQKNARSLVCDGTQWFASWQDNELPLVRYFVKMGRGLEDDWDTDRIVTCGASGGIIQMMGTDAIYWSALAYDDDLDQLHLIWLQTDESTYWKIYHARCDTPAAWKTLGNWATFGSDKFQIVNSPTDHPIELGCLIIDKTNNEPIVIWAQENDNGKNEIYINVGDDTANKEFVPSSTTCISTSGGGENGHHHLSPSGVNVWEIGQEIYVAWYHKDTSTPVYRVECKRLQDPDGWMTFANWLGPHSGTTTADIIMTASNSSIGDVLGMSYWYDAPGPLSQVLVAAALDGDLYTNWFDEGGEYFGAGDEWNTAGGTAAGLSAVYGAGCTRVRSNDFRVFYHLITKSNRFKDTDIVGDHYWPIGDENYIFISTTEYGWFNPEPVGDQFESDVVACMYIKDLSGFTDENIYFVYTKGNTKPTVSIVTPKAAEGEDEQQAIYLIWDYNDSDSDPQDKYKIQVALFASGAYSSPLYQYESGHGQTGESCPIPPNTLSTGSHYIWRAKVWDDNYGTEYGYNAESEWSAGTNDFWTTLPPVLEITSYEQLIETRWPRIDYTLLNNAEKLFSFGTAEYRIDASIWKAMTEKTGVGSEGLSGLSTGTPSPDSHVFYWDAETDEPGKYSTDIDIRMKGFVPSKDYPQWSDLEEELDGTLDTKAPVVSLTSPIDGDTLNDTTPEFIWPVATDDSSLCASGAYLWQLDTVPTFNSGNLREYGWTNDLSYTVSLPLDQGMTYYWRIKARDKYHNIGESPAWHFDEEGVAITDYLRISGNQKIYKIHNFTLKVEENNAALLNGDLGEYTEGED